MCRRVNGLASRANVKWLWEVGLAFRHSLKGTEEITLFKYVKVLQIGKSVNLFHNVQEKIFGSSEQNYMNVDFESI